MTTDYHLIADVDLTPDVFIDDNYCEQCGHHSSHRASLYKEDNEVFVGWSDEISCYDWIHFKGTVSDFISWIEENDPFIDNERKDDYNDFMETVKSYA